jgi:hypothetical protein
MTKSKAIPTAAVTIACDVWYLKRMTAPATEQTTIARIAYIQAPGTGFDGRGDRITPVLDPETGVFFGDSLA